MDQPARPRERGAPKGAAGGPATEKPQEAMPSSKFREMTRRLLRVTRKEVEDRERIWRERKGMD